MKVVYMKKILVNIYIIFFMVTVGFMGIVTFQGVTDNSGIVTASTTLYVGGTGAGNNSTIQEAINYANAGDTIRGYSGTYAH